MTELQQRNQAFREFLETLNPAQRKAVDKTEGPLVVIAGPGTGKTHILAARIGNILLNTDTRAQNVLCLTFTDAGAHAMRTRLLARIGPEAHRVSISTFHSFCNRVIQENLELFGYGGLEPLTELERIEVVRDLLLSLPPEHPLREGRKNVFQFEGHVRSLFANMKKEGWTPGFVIRTVDAFLQELPNNPDYRYKVNTKSAKKGDLKLIQIKDVTAKLERLKATADIFPKYQSALQKIGRYEYEDMLLWVNRAFETHEALLRIYQERYQYILVDEFQDTNGAQFHLLNQLLDYWETPNIFIVGDDDQSIYEFQGARLENLVQFVQKYKRGLEVVVLEENYRSTQGILNAAGRLIANNELRALNKLEQHVEKSLRAHIANTSEPQVRQYESRLHELTDIVSSIETLLKQGVPASEIAVLYRRHRQALPLQKLLGKKEIPFQTKRPLNILEVPVMQHFRALLQYVHEELHEPFSGDHRLFRLMHAAFLDLDPLDLANLAAEASSVLSSAEKVANAHYASAQDLYPTRKAVLWRKLLSGETNLNALKLDNPEKLLTFGKKLNQWIQDATNVSLPHLIERLYSQTGLLEWALNQPDKIWYLQVLASFAAAVPQTASKRRSSRSKHFTDLGYFLQQLENLDGNNLPLPLRQTIEIEQGIQLLTAHAAKGLEFEHVFLFDCVEDSWENNTGDTRNRFALPPTLTLSGEADALEAARRLFYVATTRAKSGLYISFAQQNEDGKALTQTQFLDETRIPVSSIEVLQEKVIDSQTVLLMEESKPVINLPEDAVVKTLLDQFSMSVTSLNRYLRCPLAFWYEDILKVPSTMSEAAAYGTAIHGALQGFFLKMKAGKKHIWPSSDQLEKIFQKEIGHLRPCFSEHSFTQRLSLGSNVLRQFHQEQIPYWRKRAIVERRVDRVEFKGVPLTGVIDKIEWLDKGLRLVDYKTGSPDNKKALPPGEQMPNGGDYWIQLAFYQILLENARIYPEAVQSTAISWVETDRKGHFPVVDISFTREEIAFVENLIVETYSKIQQKQFDTGCGKEDCSWCNMLRDRHQKGLLPRIQEEGLDD
ncbi:MAG: ATP-dependent helicase [Lewinellaceae bacterium]|nr:ATP-dependent helicase [Lewinellaceae bacterium]